MEKKAFIVLYILTASKATLTTSAHETQSSTTPTTPSTNNATSTTTGSSKAINSTLAGSSTASAFNAITSKSISLTSAAFHNTTTPSTTNATSTTTASTLISPVSPASASSTLSMSKPSTSPTTISSRTTSPLAASFNTTTPQAILSSTAFKSTAVSVTNTSTSTAGPTTQVPKIVPEIVTDLEFHSSDTFTSALDNSESQEFKNRSKLVTDQLEAVYKPKYDNFLSVIVQGFRQGSIITRTQLVFSSNQSVPSRKEISDTLLKAAETGTINPLNIISQTISVNGSTFIPATPSTETTASRASKIELHLLQATRLIIMSKILRLFL